MRKFRTVVNDVEVANCRFLLDKNKIILCKACAHAGLNLSAYCEAHPDCYYKKLLLAERKIDKITETYNLYTDNQLSEDDFLLFLGRYLHE